MIIFVRLGATALAAFNHKTEGAVESRHLPLAPARTSEARLSAENMIVAQGTQSAAVSIRTATGPSGVVQRSSASSSR